MRKSITPPKLHPRPKRRGVSRAGKWARVGILGLALTIPGSSRMSAIPHERVMRNERVERTIGEIEKILQVIPPARKNETDLVLQALRPHLEKLSPVELQKIIESKKGMTDMEWVRAVIRKVAAK